VFETSNYIPLRDIDCSEKQMKNGKKLTVLSILALTIGIAAIIPSAFLMTTNAQTDDAPRFSVDPLSAYFRVDPVDGGYSVTDMINLHTILNDNFLSQQSDARIEYFEFNFYTDNQQLLKHTFWISGTNDNYKDQTESLPTNGFPRTSYAIIHENLLNSSYLNTDYMSGIDIDLFNDPAEIDYLRGFGNSFGSKDDKYNTVADAQTIYLDVNRVCYVTVNGDTTTITWTNEQIHHFELTKSGGAFTFGTDTGNSYTDLDTFAQQAASSIDLSDTTMDDIYAEIEAELGRPVPR
jgi:hypothetical protein